MAGNTSQPSFDLQSHSTFSDGTLPPGDVVASAAAAGVELLALTDHDTLSGVSQALAAGAEHGVRVIPAIEISAVDDRASEPRELHILGYLVEHEDAAFNTTLERFLSDREQRTLRMADGLRELGWQLDDRELKTRQEAGKPIGRPHLANAVLGHPANLDRLRAEQIDDVGSLIRAYLIEGRPAFRMRQTPTVASAVEAIHQAGGVAIWAHPFWDLTDPKEVLETIDRFGELGMDGVEAFYITHTREQTQLLAKRTAELGVLSTGSADFHGPENKLFHSFRAFETFGHTPNLGPIAG